MESIYDRRMAAALQFMSDALMVAILIERLEQLNEAIRNNPDNLEAWRLRAEGLELLETKLAEVGVWN